MSKKIRKSILKAKKSRQKMSPEIRKLRREINRHLFHILEEERIRTAVPQSQNALLDRVYRRITEALAPYDTVSIEYPRYDRSTGEVSVDIAVPIPHRRHQIAIERAEHNE